jgi:hypothetical protein
MENKKTNIDAEKAEELKRKISDLERKLSEESRHRKDIQRTVGHELKNLANTLSCVPHLMKKENKKIGENPKIAEMAEMIKRNYGRLMDIYEVLMLETITPEEIRKKSQKFDLGEMARDNILEKKAEINEKRLEVELYYDQPERFPMTIRTHKGLLSATLQTIYVNQIAHAPRESKIKHLYTADTDNLIMYFENLIGESDEKYRKFQSGIGMRIVETFTKELGGNFTIYDVPEIRTISSLKESYGNKDSKEFEGIDTYGLKIEIPITEVKSE